MNKNKNTAILSIFPNHRGFGYALMDGWDLVEYGIACPRVIRSATLIKRFLEFLDEPTPEHKPGLVVLRKLSGKNFGKRNRLKRLLGQIKELCIERRLPVKEYGRVDIRFAFSNLEKNDKQSIAVKISETIGFEELKGLVPKPRLYPNHEGHTMAIFDAVALLITHYHSLGGNKN